MRLCSAEMYEQATDQRAAGVRTPVSRAPRAATRTLNAASIDTTVGGYDALARQLAAAVMQRAVPIESRARRPTLARMPTSVQWKRNSRLRGHKRSAALLLIDDAVLDYELLVNALADAQSRLDQLGVIEGAIQNWKQAKGGYAKAAKTSRGASVDDLLEDVRAAQEGTGIELKRAKIQNVDPALLQNLPQGDAERGRELFDRFMAHFRARRVRYTLVTQGGQVAPWDGGAGPFACGTFARALADLAKAAGLEAAFVQVEPHNFVTPLIDDDFIDSNAQGNVQIADARAKRYFFTQHWVTQIGHDLYCPTSGKVLSGLDVPELMDAAVGELEDTGAITYESDKATVTRIGRTDEGGGLYELVVAGSAT